MLSIVRLYLLRIGNWLKSLWIDYRTGDLTKEEKEQAYGRSCIVCLSRFLPRFEHHHLCDRHEEKYVRCWNQACRRYFEPLDSRMSETYCPRCRATGEAKDLLEDLILAGKLPKQPRASTYLRPSFEGPHRGMTSEELNRVFDDLF